MKWRSIVALTALGAGYIKATNDNLGRTKLRDVGNEYRKSGWSGYVAGLPFPKPKDGLQVAANFLGAYGGDDADRYYDVIWISAKKGMENTEYWHWMSLRELAAAPRLRAASHASAGSTACDGPGRRAAQA